MRILLLTATIDRPVSRWDHLTPDQQRALEFLADDPDTDATTDTAAAKLMIELFNIGAADMVNYHDAIVYRLTKRGAALYATRGGGETCPHCHGWQGGWMTDETQTDSYGCSVAYRWTCDVCSNGVVVPHDPKVERMRGICLRLPYATKAAVLAAGEAELAAILRRAAFYMLSPDEREWLVGVGIRNGAAFNPPRDCMPAMRRSIKAAYKQGL